MSFFFIFLFFLNPLFLVALRSVPPKDVSNASKSCLSMAIKEQKKDQVLVVQCVLLEIRET